MTVRVRSCVAYFNFLFVFSLLDFSYFRCCFACTLYIFFLSLRLPLLLLLMILLLVAVRRTSECRLCSILLLFLLRLSLSLSFSAQWELQTDEKTTCARYDVTIRTTTSSRIMCNIRAYSLLCGEYVVRVSMCECALSSASAQTICDGLTCADFVSFKPCVLFDGA